MNPMNKKTLILSISVIFAVLLLGGWLLLREPQSPPESQNPMVAMDIPPQKPEDITLPVSEVDTSNWKTYRNENSGIELKIPQEWDVLVLGTGIDGDMICFGKEGEIHSVVGGEGEVDGCAIMIGPDSWKETKTLVDVETKIISRSRELKNVFTVKNIEVGSRKSILLSYAAGNTELYVEHRNNLYQIDLRPYEYNSGDPTIAVYYRETYFGILSTIHFLD